MIRVLFVDDDSLVLAGLRRLMRRFSSEVESEFATSGAHALERLQQASFDAIVSDMRMPEMDGRAIVDACSQRISGNRAVHFVRPVATGVEISCVGTCTSIPSEAV